MSWWGRKRPTWADLKEAEAKLDLLQEHLEETERARAVLQARNRELGEALDKSRADALALRGHCEVLQTAVAEAERALRQRDWQPEQQRERARQILGLLATAHTLASQITEPVQAAAEPAQVPDEDDDGIPF
mgnify:FL=1